MTRPSTSPSRGFTLLELLIAMAIFTVLGGMTVFLMRQGLEVFTTGTRDAGLLDRVDVVLPQVKHDLSFLTIPHSFDPPPPAPPEEERMFGDEPVPPPPVDIRLRSGHVVLGDVPEGPLKGVPCRYVSFVVSRWRDPQLRRIREGTGSDAVAFTPEAVEKADDDTLFQPTGGLVELCYIAVPEDPAAPGVLTLYRGFRAPIGGPESLLDPANLDALAEVQKRCRPVARGLLHFGVTWRRVFARDWEPTVGNVGETDPYVGPTWDSTRALDRGWPLFVGPDSLADPSDDIFPAWVRLEVTLVPPTVVGYGRGESQLVAAVDQEARRIQVEDVTPFVGPGPAVRHLKVGTEWMRYAVALVDGSARTITVERSVRGTSKASHEVGTDVYLGVEAQIDLRLPVFHDRYARRDDAGGLR